MTLDGGVSPSGAVLAGSGGPPGQTSRRPLPAEVVLAARALIHHAARGGLLQPSDPDDAAAGTELELEVDGYRCLLSGPPPGLPPADTAVLSPREREIARMVAQGYPNKTIAVVLDISTWTVSTHLRRVFAKLDVHTRAAMVARVIELGLIGGERPAGSTSGTFDREGVRA